MGKTNRLQRSQNFKNLVPGPSKKPAFKKTSKPPQHKRGTYNQQFENGYGGVLSDEELYVGDNNVSTKTTSRKVQKKRISSASTVLNLPTFSVLPSQQEDDFDESTETNAIALAVRRALCPTERSTAPANPEAVFSKSDPLSSKSNELTSRESFTSSDPITFSEREEGEITLDDEDASNLRFSRRDGRNDTTEGVGTEALSGSDTSDCTSSIRRSIDVITLDRATKRVDNVANVSLPVIVISDDEEDVEPILIDDDDDDIVCVASPRRKKPCLSRRFPNVNNPPPNIVNAVDKKPEPMRHQFKGRIIPYMDNLSHYLWQKFNLHVRRWEPLTADEELLWSPENFRFVTYNILCQVAMDLHPHLYGHLPVHLRTWEFRRAKLLEEFIRLRADILCLQEVNREHYLADLRPTLVDRVRLVDVCHWRPPKPDGCVTLFNPGRFEYCSHSCLNLNLNVDVLNENNVATFLRLRCKSTKVTFVVVNTHLVFNPNRGDVKLNQIGLILAQLNKFRLTKTEPAIFAGDLNLHPGSVLHQFLVSGTLDARKNPRFDFKYISGQRSNSCNEMPPRIRSIAFPRKTNVGQNCVFLSEHSAPPIPLKLTHTFKFAPAYHINCSLYPNPDAGQLLRCFLSTCHAEFGNPDHIFYTIAEKNFPNSPLKIREKGLRIIRRLTLPHIQHMQTYCGPLPNEFCGSDHLPLVVEFNLSNN